MGIKQAIGKSIFKLAKRRGYDVIPFWKMDEIPLANHLRKTFDVYHIDIVIDVGANKGQYRDTLRNEVGFSGAILSFEPVSKYFEFLRKRSSNDKNWKVFNCALGSVQGEAEINVTQSPGLNSFLPIRTDVVKGFWKENPITGVEKVQIQTLDTMLKEANVDCSTVPVYLKLDTQGFDLEVIKGAVKTLEHIRALQTEASIQPIYQGMPSYLETIRMMNENNFDLSGIFPVTRDDWLRLIELDCIFINSRFAKT